MINVARFVDQQGNVFPVFLHDTESVYGCQDILQTPGAWQEVCTDGLQLVVAELTGSIDGYATKGMFLVAVTEPSYTAMQDITDIIKKYLQVPDTAVKMLLAKEDEDTRGMISTSLESIKACESLNTNTKVFLPEEAFAFVDESVKKSMRSTRQVYTLKSINNQEIVQKTPTSKYSVVLPDISTLHGSGEVAPSVLDILRVCAPYRREVTPGVFQYGGIYHTPHYKVDPKLRGMVPSYLGSITGYTKNDTLGIQPHEHHMYDNLYMFLCSDIARYISEVVTGIVLGTSLGQGIKKAINCRDKELLAEQFSAISGMCPEGCSVNVTYTDIEQLVSTDWKPEDVARIIKRELKLSKEFILKAISSLHGTTRVIDIENLPFVLELSDEDKEEYTNLCINNCAITRAMFDYIINLCCRAYDVNWGHSGACRAIPRFETQGTIPVMNEVMAAHLNKAIGASPAAVVDYRLLYPAQVNDEDDEDADDADDELFATFDYYITNETAQRLINGTLPSDYFTGGVTGAETTEAAIVEYRRKVDGDNTLRYFISTAFMLTGNYSVLFESFAKLMRWGELKPSLLVLEQYPEIRTVVDLNTGLEVKNTAVVDESQLVLVDGCKYTLESTVTAEDVRGEKPTIVGFLLSRDYGIKKYTLASWVDVGEMIVEGELDIAEFKRMHPIKLSHEGVNIVQFADGGADLFTSKRNIEFGLKNNIKPAQLSEIAMLCQSGVLRSIEYLKSKNNSVVVTTKDRQYQILASYCRALEKLYAEESAILNKEEAYPAELSAVARRCYELFVQEGKEQAPDVNTVRAGQAVQALNLDIGKPSFVDGELSGKFTIISDMDMASNLPSMQFTDPGMQKVSQKVRDRIVFLLLEQADCYLLCRKDISAQELLVSDHKIDHKKFAAVSQLYNTLASGGSIAIKSSKTGERKKAVLHRSMEEVM